MKCKVLILACAVGIAMLALACAPVETGNTGAVNAGANTAANAGVNAAGGAGASHTVARKAATDLEKLAERLVTQSVGVKEGEVVLISGGSQDQELLENIAVQVRKFGGFPLVTLSSDRMAKRMLTDVPEKYDTQLDALDMKLAEVANVAISVDRNLTEGLFADADQRRLATRAKAGQPIADIFRKRNVRTIEIGNGLYPTDWRAKRYGMTEDELTKTFWEGVNVDYSSLASRAEQVRGVVASGSEVQIKDSNGTDFKVKVQGRPVLTSDGIISAEDVQKGSGAVQIYLPAGEVYVTPVAGTAEGKIVRAKEYFEGKEIQNLTLTFAGGKLVSMTGSGPGFDLMKAQYDAAGEGKELFAVVDFGINPSVKLPASSAVGTWVPAGTVTVGMGNNVWAGGENKAPYGYFVSLVGANVTLDGKPIIESGQLKI
jgi:leucyl aminopeptidase (aminopeptidase T)